MPRLRQVRRADAAPSVLRLSDLLFGARDPVAEPGTATGTPGNWWTVFALVPDVFDHAVAGFALYRSPKRTIDPKLRELAMMRAGFARGSQLVFSQHCKAARSLGVPETQIRGPSPRGRHPTRSRRSSARCSPTPTASCCRAGASPTPRSRRSARACPKSRCSSSPTSRARTTCTQRCPRTAARVRRPRRPDRGDLTRASYGAAAPRKNPRAEV